MHAALLLPSVQRNGIEIGDRIAKVGAWIRPNGFSVEL